MHNILKHLGVLSIADKKWHSALLQIYLEKHIQTRVGDRETERQRDRETERQRDRVSYRVWGSVKRVGKAFPIQCDLVYNHNPCKL